MSQTVPRSVPLLSPLHRGILDRLADLDGWATFTDVCGRDVSSRRAKAGPLAELVRRGFVEIDRERSVYRITDAGRAA